MAVPGPAVTTAVTPIQPLSPGYPTVPIGALPALLAAVMGLAWYAQRRRSVGLTAVTVARGGLTRARTS